MDYNDQVLTGPAENPTGFTVDILKVQLTPRFRELKGNWRLQHKAAKDLKYGDGEELIC